MCKFTKQTKAIMATNFLAIIPAELLQEIVGHLPRKDQASLRLVSKACNIAASHLVLDPIVIGLRFSTLQNAIKLSQYAVLRSEIRTLVFDSSIYEDLVLPNYLAQVREKVRQEDRGRKQGSDGLHVYWQIEEFLREPRMVLSSKALPAMNTSGWHRYQRLRVEQGIILDNGIHITAMQLIFERMPWLSQLRVENVASRCESPRIWTDAGERNVAFCLHRKGDGGFDHHSMRLAQIVRWWTEEKETIEGIIWEGRSLASDLRDWRKGVDIPQYVRAFFEEFADMLQGYGG